MPRKRDAGGIDAEFEVFISEILPEARIFLDSSGEAIKSKEDALHRLSEMLAPSLGSDTETIERLLTEREALQSTGIGDGVAIPHTSVEKALQRAAALLLCPSGVPFDAIDGADVKIIFGVIGPKEATGEHLRVLARISRLLRDVPVRESLVQSGTAGEAFQLIESREKSLG